MPKFEDMSGKKFGMLTIISRAESRNGRTYWNCLCDCGKETVGSWTDIRSGDKASCGCKKVTPMKGQRFGRLIVLELDHITKTHQVAYWKCLCDCGTIKVIRGQNLRGGNSLSCGCCREDPDGFLHLNEKDYPNIKIVYKEYSRNAKSRNLSFELTFKDVENIIKQNCYYCGVEPQNYITLYKGDIFYYSGIDRIDNNLGYSLDNCVPCCKMCNWGKRELDSKDFLDWINRIANFQKEKENKK